jgi:C1A family cysteine protease
MFYPDRRGIIRVGGRLAGGHAYLINGVDTNKKLFRLKNSWGRNWGQYGSAYISFSDMERLIKEYGEICFATEISS